MNAIPQEDDGDNDCVEEAADVIHLRSMITVNVVIDIQGFKIEMSANDWIV